MSPPAPLSIELRILFSFFLIVFFCAFYPSWHASARMDVCKQQASTIMLEPVSRLVGNVRKLLLSRVEFASIKERLHQSVFEERGTEAAFCDGVLCPLSKPVK